MPAVPRRAPAGSLKQAIERGDVFLHGPGRPHMVAIYLTLLELALALRHMHQMGLVHCDVSGRAEGRAGGRAPQPRAAALHVEKN